MIIQDAFDVMKWFAEKKDILAASSEYGIEQVRYSSSSDLKTEVESKQLKRNYENFKRAYLMDSTVNFLITGLQYKLFNKYTLSSDDENLKNKVDVFIKKIDLMKVFKEALKDCFVFGKHVRQIVWQGNEIVYLHPLDLEDFEILINQENNRDKVYYLKSYVNEEWSNPKFKKPIKKIYYFVKDADPKNLAHTPESNAIILDIDDVIVFKHNEEMISALYSVLDIIYQKQTILYAMKNIVQRYTAPFLHIKVGVGLPAPEKPALTDPHYEKKLEIYNNYKDTIQAYADKFTDWDETKEIATPPYIEIEPIGIGKDVNTDLIKTALETYENEIYNAMLSSVSVTRAKGTELATSRTIKETINAIQSGLQKYYEDIANDLITRYIGKEGIVIFKFGDIDKTDDLTVARTHETKAKAIETLVKTGISEENIKEVWNEFGYKTEFEYASDNNEQKKEEKEYKLSAEMYY